MGFQDVMKQMFLRIAAGDVEPEEWEQWWNSNRLFVHRRNCRHDLYPPHWRLSGQSLETVKKNNKEALKR